LIKHEPLSFKATALQQRPRADDNRIVNAMAAVVTDQCILLKHKLTMFFSLLRSELRTDTDAHHSHSDHSESSDSANPATTDG
jgi:hypothetical protein